jgi:hypothetical protein
MDTVFWTGIVLGALLGLIGSVLGNLWTDDIREFLDKRKRLRLSNKKSRELQTFCYVKALREGNPTAKILFDLDQTLSNARLFLCSQRSGC